LKFQCRDTHKNKCCRCHLPLPPLVLLLLLLLVLLLVLLLLLLVLVLVLVVLVHPEEQVPGRWGGTLWTSSQRRMRRMPW
jgi:hypothetical protein